MQCFGAHKLMAGRSPSGFSGRQFKVLSVMEICPGPEAAK